MRAIDTLSKYIKNINYEFPITKSKILYKGLLPLNWYVGLLEISKAYGVRLIIDNKGEQACHYNHDFTVIIIDLNIESYSDRHEYIVCNVFTHELAHHIQNIHERYTPEKWANGDYVDDHYYFWSRNMFIDNVMFEKIAERLAYYIYKRHFSQLTKLNIMKFDHYRSLDDIRYLVKFRENNAFYEGNMNF